MNDHTYSSNYILELGVTPEDVFMSDSEDDTVSELPEQDGWALLDSEDLLFPEIKEVEDEVTNCSSVDGNDAPAPKHVVVDTAQDQDTAALTITTDTDPGIAHAFCQDPAQHYGGGFLESRVLSSGRVLGQKQMIPSPSNGHRVRLFREMGKEMQKARGVVAKMHAEASRLDQWLNRMEKLLVIQQEKIRLGRVQGQAQAKMIKELRQAQLGKPANKAHKYSRKDLENM